MSAFLFRLGRICARHPFRVLGLWLLAAVAVVALQGRAGGEFDDSERVPGRRIPACRRCPRRPVPEPGRRVRPHRAARRRRPARRRRASRHRPTGPGRARRRRRGCVGDRSVRAGGGGDQRRWPDRLPRCHLRPRQADGGAARRRPRRHRCRPGRRCAGGADRIAGAAGPGVAEQRTDRRRGCDHRAPHRLRVRGGHGAADRHGAARHLRGLRRRRACSRR